MSTFIDILEERGFVEALTHETELRQVCGQGPLAAYIGFDPTAASLHVGSLIPIMALAHLQQKGHQPIALMGGGTGLVGDPSGKTEMRKLITAEDVQENIKGIRRQLGQFLDFENGAAKLLNNGDWLLDLRYITFLRDIGRYFSVNRMLKAESYRMRLDSEEGLNFIEFNYMLLQAYDFLKLYEKYQCILQMGGSDQWGNIVAGIDLIRRFHGAEAYGLTFPLITTSGGAKMGKTATGTVWLDAGRTSPYEYYQYWINTHDDDVSRFLALFTFLPMAEIREVKELSGAELNSAKTVLAFEATRLAHGTNEAVKAYKESSAYFGERAIPENVLPSARLNQLTAAAESQEAVVGDAAAGNPAPKTEMPLSTFENEGLAAVDAFYVTGLAKSKGAARRLIQQGGGYVNGERIEVADYCITRADIQDRQIVLRAGKKKYHTIVVREVGTEGAEA